MALRFQARRIMLPADGTFVDIFSSSGGRRYLHVQVRRTSTTNADNALDRRVELRTVGGDASNGGPLIGLGESFELRGEAATSGVRAQAASGVDTNVGTWEVWEDDPAKW